MFTWTISVRESVYGPNDTGEMGRLCHAAAEEAWSQAGVVSSKKKRMSAAERVTELGAEICGNIQTQGIG